MMRWIFLIILMLAGGCSEDMPDYCPMECPDNVAECAQSSYPPPDECVGVCYEGRCCQYVDKQWTLVYVDCALP